MKTPRAGYGQLTVEQIRKTARKLDEKFGGAPKEAHMFLLGFATGLMFTVEKEGSRRYGMKADEYAEEALCYIMLEDLKAALREYAEEILGDEEL